MASRNRNRFCVTRGTLPLKSRNLLDAGQRWRIHAFSGDLEVSVRSIMRFFWFRLETTKEDLLYICRCFWSHTALDVIHKRVGILGLLVCTDVFWLYHRLGLNGQTSLEYHHFFKNIFGCVDGLNLPLPNQSNADIENTHCKGCKCFAREVLVEAWGLCHRHLCQCPV